jgi:uncharacterized phage infection (PIP) family protein YhgE
MIIKYSNFAINESLILEGKNNALNLKKELKNILEELHDNITFKEEKINDLKDSFPKYLKRIEKIEEELASLSNNYSDFAKMNDEDDEYEKEEKYIDKAYNHIEKMIEALPDITETDDIVKMRVKNKMIKEVEVLKAKRQKLLDDASALEIEIKKVEKKLSKK